MAPPVLYGDPGRLLKAADGRPVALLTYPGEDADGDLVNPAGGLWEDRPYLVNVEHLCPVGTAAVALRTLKSLPGHVLPVGTTTFGTTEAFFRGLPLGGYSPAQCVDEAAGTAVLVRKGVMTGVSLEFTPIQFKSRGKSPRWDRPAYDVATWEPLAYAHCVQPVQHHARLLLKAVPLADAALDFARTAAASGRFPGGAVISPVCRKSLATLVAGLPRPPAAARGVTPGGPAVPTLIPKALPADDTDDEYLPADEVPADLSAVEGEPVAEEAGAGTELTPTPAAFAQVAQLTSDLIAAIDAALAKSEHPDGRARLEEFRAMLADEAGSLLDDGRGMFPDAGLDAPAGATAADMDKAFKLPRAKDGTLLCKAFPKGPPLRFRLADLGPAVVPEAADPAMLRRLAKAEAALAREKRLTAGRR